MNSTVKVIISAAALTFSGLSFAQENQPDNPWTDCGIGYALFKNSEVGAAISNVIWDAGTTATTTYVSTPDNCRERDAKVAQFVGESYDSLENETAVGHGPNLIALAEIANCDAAQHSALISAIRSDYSTIASDKEFEPLNRTEKAAAYFGVVANKINGEFADSCTLI